MLCIAMLSAFAQTLGLACLAPLSPPCDRKPCASALRNMAYSAPDVPSIVFSTTSTI